MPKNPQTAVAKDQKAGAKTTAKKIAKPIKKRSHTVRTKPRFYRTNTLSKKRQSRVLRNLNTHNALNNVDDSAKILIQPLSSDKSMTKMEKEGTITFLVDAHANKVQIKAAFARAYNTKVRSVNTVIRADGAKKAFIRLDQSSEALKLASKIGIV